MATSEDKPKIPITVVTGFLGAGKTTLVNAILTGNHGKKIAVIENEFGEVGIDDALVLQTREEVFEMANGCICCTVRGDLIRILHKLLKRKGPPFDAILIETTGLAMPAPVIQTFFVDDDVKEACVLDAVLAVVDAKHVQLHLDDVKAEGVVNEAVQQIAFADKVLLNKIDLVTEAEKKAVYQRIKSINKGVEVIECQQSAVPLDKILGIHAFELDKILALDPHFLGEDGHGHDHDHEHHHHDHAHGASCKPDCKEDHEHHHDHDHDHDHEGSCKPDCKEDHEHHHGHSHSHSHAEGHAHAHEHLAHKHDDQVTSIGIVEPGSVDIQKLNAWLSGLLKERGVDIYRTKGIISLAGQEHKLIFQGVHQMLQFSKPSGEGAGPKWAPDETRVNKLVFIGKTTALNRDELNVDFKACLV